MKKIWMLLFLLCLPLLAQNPYQQGRSGYAQNILWRDLHPSTQDSIRAAISDSVLALNINKVYDDTTGMKAAPGDSAGVRVYMKQLASSNAYGGGTFVWKTSGYTPDGGDVFAATGGYWVRDTKLQKPNELNVQSFGVATTNTPAANTTAMNKVIAAIEGDTASAKIVFPDGHYKFSGSIVLNPAKVNYATTQQGQLILQGGGNTILEYTGADSFLVVEFQGKKFLQIKDLMFLGPDSGGTSIGIDYTQHSGGIIKLDNVFVKNFGIGYRAHDLTGCNIFGGQFQQNGIGIACGYKSDAWNIFGTIITRNTIGVEIGYVNPNNPDLIVGVPAPSYAQASNGQLWSGGEINYNHIAVKVGGEFTAGVTFQSMYFEWNDTMAVIGHTGSEAEPSKIASIAFRDCYFNVQADSMWDEMFYFYKEVQQFEISGGVLINNPSNPHVMLMNSSADLTGFELDTPYSIKVRRSNGNVITPAVGMRINRPVTLMTPSASYNAPAGHLFGSYVRNNTFTSPFEIGRITNDSLSAVGAEISYKYGTYGALDILDFYNVYAKLARPAAGAPSASSAMAWTMAWDTTGSQDILYAYRSNGGSPDRVNITPTLSDAVGGMYCRNKSETLTMTQFSYAHVTNATNNLFSAGGTLENVSYSADSVIVNATGKLLINVSLDFSAGTASGDFYEVALFKNNAATNWRGQVNSDSTWIQNVSFSGIESNTSGDSYCIKIVNTTNNNDATIKAATLTVAMVGD